MKIWKFRVDLQSMLFMAGIVFITYLIVLNYKAAYLTVYNINLFISELFFVFNNNNFGLYIKLLTFTTLVAIINIFIIIDLNKYTINYNKFILYRTANIKDLMKDRYMFIIKNNIFSLLTFIISMFLVGNKLCNSKVLGTTFEFSISYTSVIMLINFFLIQIFTMSFVSIICNINNYLSLVYIILLYSIFITFDKYMKGFSFLFNNNNLVIGTIVLLLLDLCLYLFRDINKYVDY